jgi:cytochrome c553
MKISQLLLTLSAVVALSACTNVERSRTLSDANVKGETFAKQVCSACHGLDGNSISPEFPKLSAQQPAYITAQLENFKTHARTDRYAGEIMYGLSHPLTAKQEEEIGAYFSSQTPVNLSKVQDPQGPGKNIFENGVPDRGVLACQTCHGPSAAGLGTFPRLAGQHREYIVKQLHVFRDTQGRPGTAMDVVVKTLTDQDIEQVATYLSSL